MRRLLRLSASVALALVLSMASLEAQSISTTGSIDANGEAVTFSTGGVSLPSGGWATTAVQITGTFTGTLQFEGSVDVSTYVALLCTPINTTTATTSATATGLWSCPTAGLQQVRVRSSAWTSGTASVYLRGTPSGGAGSGGGGGGGGGDASFAEQQTQTTHLAAIETAVEGPLNVQESGAALTSIQDIETSANTVASAVDATGAPKVFVAMVDPTTGLPVELASDAETGEPATVSGPQVKGKYSASALATPTADDAQDFWLTAGGALNVAQNGTWTVQPGNTANTTAWLVRNSDPCSGPTKSYLPINISTATTTEITPALAGASTHYYVCAISLITAAANNVALVDDDTDNCASVTAGLAGGITAASGWNFAANGGISLGNGSSAVFRTVTQNAVLCIVTSAATQLSGHLVVAAGS